MLAPTDTPALTAKQVRIVVWVPNALRTNAHFKHCILSIVHTLLSAIIMLLVVHPNI